jgi:NAD(P)-dependent dehydrogenase (short-subunit alcohol dehydrogenase family)
MAPSIEKRLSRCTAMIQKIREFRWDPSPRLDFPALTRGLIQMTKVLAFEWAAKYNITVNAIAPGYISTDLTEGMRASEKISKNLLQRTPIRRFGEPDEIVGAALYLASESSTYTTGTVIIVDGRWMVS